MATTSSGTSKNGKRPTLEERESSHSRLLDLPDLDVSREHLMEMGQEVVERGRRFWDGFFDFALQDNILEIAVGLIIAAAFTTVVSSFVSEILLPPISLLPFINRNLEEKFAILRRGPKYVKGIGYNTLEQAAADGAVVMAYGTFLNKILNFVGVGLALYMVASFYEWASSDSIIKHTIKCKYCRKRISTKAQRCVNCTSWQDGREDRMT